jgi:hemoglobin
MTNETPSTLIAIDEPNQTPYSMLGGEVGVRQLVDTFYDLMSLEDKYQTLRALHPEDMSGSRDKLFWFLSGWLGGPDLFVERFGHPRLRARHLPYAIGVVERDQWVACMWQAMQMCSIAEPLQQRLVSSFFNTADWMRNKDV